MINKVAVGMTLVILAVFGALLFAAFHYHAKSVAAAGQLSQLGSDNALQSQVIATQAFNFQRANLISAAAQQYAVQVGAKSQEKNIEYRTVIKRDPASRQCVVDSVANRLLDYTHSLRTSSMHADTGKSTATNTPATSTGCRLTYGQAVYWIDPLLSTIDKLNNQLASIQQAEEARQQ